VRTNRSGTTRSVDLCADTGPGRVRDAITAVRSSRFHRAAIYSRITRWNGGVGLLLHRRGIRHIVAGMCETDYSGYPDCRDDSIKALQVALNLGMQRRFVLHTPLMWIDKAATFKLAQDLGGPALLDLILEETHTCYLGDRTHRHDWGYGCGTCPACELRAGASEV
jgi:hypothetical protein